MIKYLSLTFLGILLPLSSFAANYSARGYLSAKASRYNETETSSHSGQNHRAQLEQEMNFGLDLAIINQVRWNYSSTFSDLSSTPSTDAKDTHKFYLGDNYLKLKTSNWVLQTGLQEIAWGEAFGFNYADIINPKDLKETFYSNYSESRLPLFLTNFKYFFNDGSLQLIHSPEPKYSETLPINLYTKNTFQQSSIILNKQDTPNFFDENEYGGKLSKSFLGVDGALFYYNYIDRDAYYTLSSATLTSIVLNENHSRINTTGLSLATSVLENFVFRTDVVFTKNKKINSVSGLSLLSTSANVTNLLISLDTPTYNKFSGVLIFAESRLNKKIPLAFREKTESYAIGKVSYDFGEEKIFDLSYTHEFTQPGHGLQSLFTWPVSNTLDFRIGTEVYWGDKSAQLYKIKNVSNIFFNIKNYFQL